MSPIQRTTLREQVLQQILRDYVQAGKPGDILPGQRQLCAEFGVSLVTVREAVQTLVEQGFLERRHGSGTFILDPASRTRKHIAILMEADVADPHLSPFYPRLLQEIRLCLLKRGLSKRTYLGHLRSDLEIGHLTCEELSEDIQANRISGVIALFARKHASWLAELHKRSIPVIGEKRAADYVVGLSPRKVVEKTLLQFAGRGRRRLAFLGCKRDYASAIHLLSRQLAPEYGFELAETLASLDPTAPDYCASWDGFRKLWLVGENRPDCLLIADNMLFAEAQAILREQGDELLEAKDLVVIGSDAVDLPVEFPITHCSHSTALRARLIVDAMQQRLAGKEIAPFIEVPIYFETVVPRQKMICQNEISDSIFQTRDEAARGRSRLISNRGFTLMELLITLVIVAILAALVVGASMSVFDASRGVQCTRNLQLIGVNLRNYIQENQSILPPTYDYRLKKYWFELICPDVPRLGGAFTCPANKLDWNRNGFPARGNYMWNIAFGTDRGSANPDSETSVRFFDIADPSQAAVISEAGNGDLSGDQATFWFGPRMNGFFSYPHKHKKSCNVLMLDGSVVSMNREQTITEFFKVKRK